MTPMRSPARVVNSWRSPRPGRIVSLMSGTAEVFPAGARRSNDDDTPLLAGSFRKWAFLPLVGACPGADHRSMQPLLTQYLVKERSRRRLIRRFEDGDRMFDAGLPSRTGVR